MTLPAMPPIPIAADTLQSTLIQTEHKTATKAVSKSSDLREN